MKSILSILLCTQVCELILSQNLSESKVQPKNRPQIKCTTGNGQKGECVQSYQCDRNTNFIIEDGADIFDVRIQEDSGIGTTASCSCPMPMVCCQVADDPNEPSINARVRVHRDMKRSGCGWRNPEGVNVTEPVGNLKSEYAKPGEFPWTVGIMSLINRVQHTAFFKYHGSGALINEKVVLTAAHIFDNYNLTATRFYITVGDHDQNSRNVQLPRKAIAVEGIETHNGYNNYLNNDFALVFLSKPITVSSHVNFICLPPANVDAAHGSRCFSSGWGNNGLDKHQYILNKAELPVVDRNTCQAQHRTAPNLESFVLHPSFMCAGGEGRKDSCKGSGGSPLACPIQGQQDRYMLSGVVSWSYNCSFDGLPSVYARVSNARSWIDSKMAAKGYTIPMY